MDSLHPKAQIQKAISLVILASFFNTIMLLFAKFGVESLSIPVVVCARFLITLLIIFPLVYLNPSKKDLFSYLKTTRWGLHLIRSIFGVLSVLCYFYTVRFISLTHTIVLYSTAPLFIPLITYFWGGLKIYPRLWWGIGIGFLGIVILLNPIKDVFEPTEVFGVLAGLFIAISFVGNRYLAYTEPALRSLFYYFLFGTIISFIILLISDTSFWINLNQRQILFLLGIGVSGYFYQLFFSMAASFAPVRFISPFMFFSVIFSLILDWLVWNILPPLDAFLGLLLILIGVLLLVLYPKNDLQKE